MAGGSSLWDSVKKSRNAYLFIAPYYLVFLVFLLFPIGFSFLLSFQEWNGILSARFVGLENYREALRDPGLHNALLNTFIFTALTVIISTVSGLALALFLNTVRIFKRFYRAVFFIPAIVSLVVVSLVWKLILNSDVGLLREVMDSIGRVYARGIAYVALHLGLARAGEDLQGFLSMMSVAAGAFSSPQDYVPAWMTGRFRLLDNPLPLVPLITMTLVNVWAVVGFNTVIYLAGLQGLPAAMYDASRIDGANKLHNFRYITWPLLRPTTFFVVLMSTIDALQVFVLPQVMKQDSDDTMTVVYYLYRNAFQFYNMGYASAIAYLLFGITVILGIGLRLTLGRAAQWMYSE